MSNSVHWKVAGSEITVVNLGFAWSFSPEIELQMDVLQTTAGFIYHNLAKVGEIHYSTELGHRTVWYSGDPVRIRFTHGDQLTARIETPFVAEAVLDISRVNLIKGSRVSSGLATESKALSQWAEGTPNGVILETLRKIRAGLPANLFNYSKSPAGALNTIREYANNQFDTDAGSALIYSTTTDTLDALALLTPPSPFEIFSSWGRFQGLLYYPPGVTPPEGSDASAWVWDEELNSAVQPLNTSAYVGFVSKELSENYEHDVTLKSTANDDDIIGVVLAFKEVGGEAHTLSLTVNPGGLVVGTGILAVTYNYGTAGAGYKVLENAAHVPQSAGSNQPGGQWLGRSMRVLVKRQGSSFTIRASDWDSRELMESSLIEFSLNDDPVMAEFEGPCAYGYSAVSQPGTYFSQITFNGGVLWDTVVDAETGNVYRYDGSAWNMLSGVSASDVYGRRKRITSYESGFQYYIDQAGQITLVQGDV